MVSKKTKGRWFDSKPEAQKYAKSWEKERKVFAVTRTGAKKAQYYVTAGPFPAALKKAKAAKELTVEPV